MKRSTAVAHVAAELDRISREEARPEDVAERIVATLEANREWDPEEPELPDHLILYDKIDPIIISTPDKRPWWPNVALQEYEGEPKKRALIVTLLAAMVAAYNREREEERMEAEVGPILDEGIPRLLDMEIAKEVEKGVQARAEEMADRWQRATEELVQGERSRCAHILLAIRAVFAAAMGSSPSARIFVRELETAIHKINSGESLVRAWTGADDLPDPEPADAPLRDTILREREKANGQEWEPSLAWCNRDDDGWPWQIFCSSRYRDEIDRRWQEEPRLRELLDANRREVSRLSEELKRSQRSPMLAEISRLREQIERAVTRIDTARLPGSIALDDIRLILTGKEP